jgi:hypothetical protein
MAHPDISAFMFSSRPTFDRILDNPSVVDGDVWLDHIHPTTMTHYVFATDIAEYLDGIEGWVDGTESNEAQVET